MESRALDRLTGLPDPEVFDLYLHSIDALAQRSQRPYSVIRLELDGLDRLGPTARGDALRTFAEVLRRTLRTEDLAAWLGDGRFVALLPETELPGAVAAAERIREALIAESVREAGLGLTTNAGVSTWRLARAAQGVCDRALELLTVAKEQNPPGAIAAEARA